MTKHSVLPNNPITGLSHCVHCRKGALYFDLSGADCPGHAYCTCGHHADDHPFARRDGVCTCPEFRPGKPPCPESPGTNRPCLTT